MKSESRPEDLVMVIFGATGDLSMKKLIPSLFSLHKSGMLPGKFAIIGAGRSPLSDNQFSDKMAEGLKSFPDGEVKEKSSFIRRLFYVQADPGNDGSFNDLAGKLKSVREELEIIDEKTIFYLSTPPSMYGIIPGKLAEAGLSDESKGWKRLIIEKPFGYDKVSAEKLDYSLRKDWNEGQIYRIDHYLGKETVQNILVTRFSNGIYEPLWNRNYINYVEITSAENTGIEKRGGYYDDSGALRDMVQNHLLQLAGLVAMEPPASINADSIRNEIVKVFQSIRPIKIEEVGKVALRGQYLASTINGKRVKGYREEDGIDPLSVTETYAALKFYIDNWRWGGVPFFMRTGKQLPSRVTEAVIHFKPTPHHLFVQKGPCDTCNQLIIRIQPDEGILLRMAIKTPGAGFEVQNVSMDFHYSDLPDSRIPDAYERLLLDSMIGDKTLYARIDAVMTAWEFMNPILDAWKNDPGIPVHGYPAGTWGPVVAEKLMGRDNMTWREPCAALTGDDNFCTL